MSPGDAPAPPEVPNKFRNSAFPLGIRRQITRGNAGMGSQLEKVVLLCIFSPDSGYPQGSRRQFRGNTTLHQALPLVKGRGSTKIPRQKIFLGRRFRSQQSLPADHQVNHLVICRKCAPPGEV